MTDARMILACVNVPQEITETSIRRISTVLGTANADAILAALAAAGLAVVPREPTKAMTDARDVILKVLHSYSTKDSFIDWERSDADAILSAFNAAGLAVVPREPTKAMMEAGMARSLNGWYSNVWRAMVGAAKGGKPIFIQGGTTMSDAERVMLKALNNFTRLDQTMPHEMVAAQLAALNAAGMLVVPRKPTVTMVKAGVAVSEDQPVRPIWRAMVGAAKDGE